MIKMSYTVTRGAGKGTELQPHRHEDGKYVASMTRFERDYVRVDSLRELLILVRKGFRIRMSNQDSETHRAPSLIAPENLRISEPAECAA